jgi:hypothetical protein
MRWRIFPRRVCPAKPDDCREPQSGYTPAREAEHGLPAHGEACSALCSVLHLPSALAWLPVHRCTNGATKVREMKMS